MEKEKKKIDISEFITQTILTFVVIVLFGFIIISVGAIIVMLYIISPFIILTIIILLIASGIIVFLQTETYKEIKEKRKIIKEEQKNKKLSYTRYSDLHSSNFFILGEEDFLEENDIEKSIRTTTKGKTLGVEDSESIWGYFKDEVQLKNNRNEVSEKQVYSVFENHEDRSRKNGK